MRKNKQRTGEATTLYGVVVSSVALNRKGIPILDDKMRFLTIGKSGSVKTRGVTNV
jgi:hypothetical protein